MKRLAWLLLLVLLPLGCSKAPAPSVAAAGLHNVQRVSDRLFSGSSPEGDAGFRSLRELGVRTVLSVDGARPKIELAHKHGLRYVHLPIGYDGLTQEQALRLARAIRDLPAPVYLHCHHGKHRGPAAAAAARLFLDERYSVEEAVAVMKRAGTDPRYTGLYAAPGSLRRPTREELDRVPADFVEVAEVPAVAQIMVRIDERYENLKLAKAAGWRAPSGHPDIDPAHEALQLAELYREMARLPVTQERPAKLRAWLATAEEEAIALEAVLRQGSVDSASPDRAYAKVGASCARCHARYRDAPQSAP
jgi:protein tyrosine phosphatase (PTP) superfamily phosphohydrolase (DUF442 family)